MLRTVELIKASYPEALRTGPHQTQGMNMISIDTRELSVNALELVSGGKDTTINFGKGMTLTIENDPGRVSAEFCAGVDCWIFVGGH